MNNIEIIKIEDLIFDPANLRKHGKKNIDAIKGSVARFNQQTPIVIDRKNIVRKGNGTLAAVIELGWKEIKVIRTDLDGSEATAYAIADNRTSELAEWDNDALKDTLQSLADDGFDLSDIGFDDSDMGNLFEDKNENENDNESNDTEGEIKFGEVLGEANNYVVLLFKNEIDWLAAKDHFDIKSTKDREGRIGTGRMIDGATYLMGLQKDV